MKPTAWIGQPGGSITLSEQMGCVSCPMMGVSVTPLYTQDDIDSAVLVEREACLSAVRGVMLTDHSYNTWKRCIKAIKIRSEAPND